MPGKRRVMGLSRLNFFVFADGPCQSHCTLEIRFKKKWRVLKGKNEPRKCKGQRSSPDTERHQSRKPSVVFGPASSSRSAAKCQRQSKRVHLASALPGQDCGHSSSVRFVSGTHQHPGTSIWVRPLTAATHYWAVLTPTPTTHLIPQTDLPHPKKVLTLGVKY